MPRADGLTCALLGAAMSLVPLPGLGTPLCPQAQVLQQGYSGTSNFSSLQEQAEPFRVTERGVSQAGAAQINL